MGQSLEHPELTPQDVEKKQRVWWYLLLAGALALLGEAMLSNRLARRFGPGCYSRARNDAARMGTGLARASETRPRSPGVISPCHENVTFQAAGSGRAQVYTRSE